MSQHALTTHKLAIFDIDGTIAVKGVVPESVIMGMKRLHALGFLTTVSTGRSYRRLQDALGMEFNTVISPDALIIVEHGTKIVHRDGGIVQADYFSSTETDHFVDFVCANQDMVKFCMYALPDPTQPLELWVKDPKDMGKIQEKRGSYADIFHCSYEELKSRMNTRQITHALAKLQDFITVENLKLRFTRSKMNVNFMDGYMQFVGSFSDKAKAIGYLEKFHEVNIGDMLLAGNAINDIDMLNLNAGTRILVGNDEYTPIVLGHLHNIESITRVDSPEALGVYLQKLS